MFGPLEELTKEILFKAKANYEFRKKYSQVDKAYIKDMQAKIDEVFRESEQVTKANHGGGSPFPFKY